MLKWASSQDAASILQDDSCHAHEAVLAVVNCELLRDPGNGQEVMAV